MTNNSENSLCSRNTFSERTDRLTDRTTSGRTELTDRTIIIPEYTLNGRHAGLSSRQRRHENGSIMETEYEEFTVPILPIGLAVVCGVLNFTLPGFGELIINTLLLQMSSVRCVIISLYSS